jgi:hypothetical protein
MRRAAFLVALLSHPAFAASPTFLSMQPDRHGGATAFALVASQVIAIPVDAAGTAHPDQGTLVFSGEQFSLGPSFSIAPTSGGYVMAYTDLAGIAWAGPLGDDFKPVAPARPLGQGSLASLTCSDGLCATLFGSAGSNTKTLLLMDAGATPVAQSQSDVFMSVVATHGRFALLRAPSSVQVVFVDAAGAVTGTATVGTILGFGATIAPHPLGAAVFWANGTQIAAAVVRSDGTVAARASFTAPDLSVYKVHAAYGGGELGLNLTTIVVPGESTQFGGIPPVTAVYAMRVSESLDLLEGPTALTTAQPSSSKDIIAIGDAFFALYSDPLLRLTRIPFTGPIATGAGRQLELQKVVHRRSAGR